MTNNKFYRIMKKNTLSLKCKVRWLKTKPLLLMLFGLLFSFFGANAQTCTVMTNDFLEDFESASANATVPNSCWTRDAGGGYYQGYVYTWLAYSGSKSYYMYMDDGGEVTLISPETDDLGGGDKQLRFYFYYDDSNLTSPNLEIYSMDDNSSTATKTLIQSIPLLSTNKYTWIEYIIPLPATDDDYFAFSLSTPSGKNYLSAFLDEIYYEDLSPCFFPMNIEVSDITANEATISWDPSIDGNVTGYEYEIRTSGDPGSGATGLADSGTTTNTEVDITGLDDSTTYYVYVRSVCGTSEGMWTLYPIDFMTLCPVFDDFFEGFENTATASYTWGPVPNCWTLLYSLAQPYSYAFVNTNRAKTGDRSYLVYYDGYQSGANDYYHLISPETDNLGGGSKRVRFSAYFEYGNPSTVPVNIVSLDSNTSSATATLVQTVSVSGQSWSEHIVNLPATTDDYFAFSFPPPANNGYFQIFIDDIYYEEIPLPQLSFTKFDNICYGESKGVAVVNVAEGLPPFTYSWSPVTGNTSAI